jgi:hypothetical protein
VAENVGRWTFQLDKARKKKQQKTIDTVDDRLFKINGSYQASRVQI